MLSTLVGCRELVRTRQRTTLTSIVILFSLWIAPGCGDDTVGPAPAGVDEYLQSLPSWSAFSPAQPDFDGATGDPTTSTESAGGVDYDCTTIPYRITSTPDKISTLNPDVEILWPGVLLQGKGHLGGIGTLQELPIRQRTPLTLSIDLLTDGNSRIVSDPTLATVTQTIGDLIQSASDAGHVTGSRISFGQRTSHSLEESTLRLGLSAAYMGASIKASLQTTRTVETNTIMASYTQQMFTVSTVLPQTPGELFSNAFTEGLLQEQIRLGRLGPDNLPVYVSSVVYGRTLVFSMTSASSVDSMHAALDLAYGDISVGAEGAYRSILEQAQFSLVTVGGDAANAEALIRSGNFTSYFETGAALTTARPISYTVRNLADNTIARVSETTTYDIRNCSREPQTVTGAVYRVNFENIYWGQFCGAPPAIQEVFRVEGTARSTSNGTVLGAQGGPFLLAWGETEWLNSTCPPHPANQPQGCEFTLHYDARDFVVISGFMSSQLGIVEASTQILRRVIPSGPYDIGLQSATGCNGYALRFSIYRVRDVFD